MKLHDARVGIIATASSQTFVWAIAISVNILAANKFPWSAIVVDGSRAPGSARMLGDGSPCLWWFVIVSKPHPGRRRPWEVPTPGTADGDDRRIGQGGGWSQRDDPPPVAASVEG